MKWILILFIFEAGNGDWIPEVQSGVYHSEYECIDEGEEFKKQGLSYICVETEEEV